MQLDHLGDNVTYSIDRVSYEFVKSTRSNSAKVSFVKQTKAWESSDTDLKEPVQTIVAEDAYGLALAAF